MKTALMIIGLAAGIATIAIGGGGFAIPMMIVGFILGWVFDRDQGTK